MSVEDARKFAEKVSSDEKLAQKVSVAASAREVVSLGKENGFAFTIKDLKTLDAEWGEPKKGVLSDEELESVASGRKYSTKRRCGTLGSCLTKKDTCGTPCCIIEPL
jgi:predicted ribosomally synthesized peptide with nif11-like leader